MKDIEKESLQPLDQCREMIQQEVTSANSVLKEGNEEVELDIFSEFQKSCEEIVFKEKNFSRKDSSLWRTRGISGSHECI